MMKLATDSGAESRIVQQVEREAEERVVRGLLRIIIIEEGQDLFMYAKGTNTGGKHVTVATTRGHKVYDLKQCKEKMW